MMIAQITDLHVRPRGKVAYERVDTNAMLEAAVAAIESLPRKPDLVIATGDLTDCGLAAEYEVLRDILDPLSMPVYLVPGNHDRGWEMLNGVVPIFADGLDLGDWRVVHGDGDFSRGAPCVMGHWHPVTRRLGRRVPCYLVGAQCLVLPAFTADAAGDPNALTNCGLDLRTFGIAGRRVVECPPPTGRAASAC